MLAGSMPDLSPCAAAGSRPVPGVVQAARQSTPSAAMKRFIRVSGRNRGRSARAPILAVSAPAGGGANGSGGFLLLFLVPGRGLGAAVQRGAEQEDEGYG